MLSTHPPEWRWESGTPVLCHSQTVVLFMKAGKQIVYEDLRGAPGVAGQGKAQPHRAEGLSSQRNSKQCCLHGNYTAKGQAECMAKADRPRDPRAISLGFDSWLVRALTKYSIFIFALHSLPLTGMVIENSGMKVRGHLSAGPSMLPAQTSSS